MEGPALESRIDALYQLVPGEFVAARNALAKELTAAGHKDAAQRVKKLAKSTVTAWAVNRVVGDHAKAYRKALDAGQNVRAALTGEGTIQDAMAARRRAVDALTQKALAELEAVGGHTGPDTARRMGRSLEALVTAPAEGVVPGRLTHDLEPPGFEAVMGMAPAVPAEAPSGRAGPSTRKNTEETGRAPKKPARGGTGGNKKTSRERSDASEAERLDLTARRANSARREKTRRALAEAEAAKQAVAQTKAQQSELRAARAAGLKRVREAKSRLEAAERRQAAAVRAVERTSRARAAAQAELDRASQAEEEALEHHREEEARVEECMTRVAEAQEALDALESPAGA